MKKPTLQLNKLSLKSFFIIWLIFHVGLISFFGITFLTNPGSIKLDADLFNMFPKPFEEESIRKADEKLTEATGQNVFILVANKDFNKARTAAVNVYDALINSSNFNSVNLYSDMGSMSEITDFIYKYRWNMLDDESIDMISSEGGAEVFAQNALATAYSPFTMMSLDNLDMDPFMLAENNLNNYLNAVQSSGVAMSPKDGVLASEKDGTWYVMIRGILSKKGAALVSKDNGVTEIYSVCKQYENDGTRFVYSGTPFHSHKSSNSASREVTIISTVSMLLVIIMLLSVFRTPKPLLFSVLSILISVATAVSTTLAVFHKMHILTLVFGTSLIGSSIDYSLHFFTQWAGNAQLKSGKEIRDHLMPGLTMAIISSGLCFIILLFAPFNLLKQMSTFCVSGLISSFLTTLAIFPYIPIPDGERKIKFIGIMKTASNKNLKKNIGRIGITVLFVFTIGSILIWHKNVKIENNVTKLYKIEGEMLANETEVNSIIKYSPTGWFIIRGDSEEKTLETEEKLTKKIDELTNGTVGYISTSLFIPSIERQIRSRAACEKLLALAEDQLEALGYDASDAEYLREEFAASANDFISIEKGNVPEFLTNSISTAWLGQINGQYYTVVMPNIIPDEKAFKAFVQNEENVFFINKLADISSDLDRLTKMVLEFFAIAYIVMFVVLKFFYNWKQAFKIISIPLIIVLLTASVFAISNIRLEFFSVTGLILVFGLGLDYIIYMMENERNIKSDANVLEPFATMLSFITTVVSFGALALSSFTPVHLIGLSIFLGLTAAYTSSMLYDRSL